MAKSGIYIKPSKRGTFTAAAKKRGKSVSQFERQVLANPESYSPAMRKKAQFSANARKWKKELGGYLDQQLNTPIIEETPINNELVPQTTFRGGGSLTPFKAKTILSHGSVQGRPLTKKQQGFFGAIAGNQSSQLQEGGQLPTEYLTLNQAEKNTFADDAAAMGHTLAEHAEHIFVNGGQLPQWLYEARGRAMKKLQEGGDLAQLMRDNPDLKNLKHYGQYTGANLATDLGLLAGGIGGAIGGIRGTSSGQERRAEDESLDLTRLEPIEGLVSQPFDVQPVQLAPREKQFGGILPINVGYGVPMEFSDTQQEGYYPAYSDGGELLGYLPKYSFGSWLGDNAGKILKGAGGIVSAIPILGQIAGPALIGAGAATDMIVGGVRKKRAEGEFEEAQERQRTEQGLRERKSALESRLQPQTEYAATFGYQDGGALMGQPQQNQVPIINEYSGNANTHQQGVGGVPVDAQGNPSLVSKQSAVGLTEVGEVTWSGYVFSDKLPYNG